MGGRKKYLKALAFVPAIVLVGTFVGCHGGAFQMFSKPEPKSEPQPTAAPQAPPEGKPTFMPGPKSMLIGIQRPSGTAPDDPANSAPAAPPPAPENKPPVFFSGSKSPNLPGIVTGLTPAAPAPPRP